MLLNDETVKEFGYDAIQLSVGSKKRIMVKCDYCGVTYDVINKNRNNSNRVINKDACNGCKYTKRDESCMIKYNTTNPGSIQVVKDKIKKVIQEKYGCNSYTQTEEFMQKSAATKIEKYGTTHTNLVPEIAEKIKRSVQIKYGVDSVFASKEVQEKSRKTCLEKYGAEYYLQLPESHEGIRQTNMEKYGVENQFQRQEIKEQIKETNNERLGVDYPMQNEAVKQKSRLTNLDRYGHEYACQAEEVKDKIKETNLARYGHENPAQSTEIHGKMVDTNLERYGVEYTMKNDEIQAKARKTAIENGTIKIYNNKTMKELSEEAGKAYSTFVVQVRKFGFDQASLIKSHENGLEAVIKNYLDELGVEYQQHGRVAGRYTDFLIEGNKLIIELDGLYWHSDRILSDRKYHATKQKTYEDNGYRSLFFREDEVFNKLDIVKSIILNALKRSERLYARKCQIRKVDTQTANQFFKKNHLMGAGKGQTYGLFYKDVLVSAVRIKRKVDKNYEISRFCNLLDFGVIGGFSRLLRYVEQNLDISSLLTFIDKRYGVGAYLESIGFANIKTHLSFKWTDTNETFGRMQFTNNTGYESGLAKIWDCGQVKFLKIYS